jgi:hypothetical protein
MEVAIISNDQPQAVDSKRLSTVGVEATCRYRFPNFLYYTSLETPKKGIKTEFGLGRLPA